MRHVRTVWSILARGIAIVLVSGLAGATLIRFAPGFGIDERVLDARLSAESLAAVKRQHSGERNPLAFYFRYIAGMLRGDAGRSVVFARPVADLIAERAPATIRAASCGLALAWSVALLVAAATALSHRAYAVLAAFSLSGSLLSIPSAVLATICLLLRLSPAIAIAAVVLPRVYPHAYEQLRAALAAPHVVMARARGLPRARVFLYHVVPQTLLPLAALTGVSVTMALGASIPIEALADSPGLGQLAWRAALGRDVPVLVTITVLLTAITVTVNVVADIVSAKLGRSIA